MRVIRYVAAALLAASTAPAAAQTAPPPTAQDCKLQLDDLTKEWRAVSFPTPSKPSQMKTTGKGGHEHTGSEVTFMREQINRASHLCSEGKEHEAMLRMDVVRAWLKLPEVQHPSDHRYSLDAPRRQN